LQRDSNAAKSILEDAIHRGNNSLLILNDLVVAYAMEADRTRSNDDYIRALAIADQVLSKDISDPTALFNRAIGFWNVLAEGMKPSLLSSIS